jgi:hypothetical protein
MGTQTTAIDPAELDLTAAQLDEIFAANRGRAWFVCKQAILAWHMEAIAGVRAEAWVPGLARSNDPVVEEALSRFYRHHMRVAIGRLKAENEELRRKLLDAVACVRFYESGASDAGERAHTMLEQLEQRAPGEAVAAH